MASATRPRPVGRNGRAEEIGRAVGAGRPVAVETVDFGDPKRPKVCLEVDFPILPVNQIATIEGNAGKPIYQMSKWWARRRSSVFRSMLIASAMKAPDDPAQAAKAVWDVYYANHQKRGALKNLRVADIFMGGGTTVVEGTRLGMQLFGVDLNPVAWFVVKNELARVDIEKIQALLDDVERTVKPQVMPFYACECPRGHQGEWTRLSTGEIMGSDFDPLALSPEERKDYAYAGPEIVYVFWAKHGPCQVKACGHRTPIISSPVMAVKTLTVRAWDGVRCPKCRKPFDVEEDEARMAPSVPFVVAEDERAFSVLDRRHGVTCPHCGYRELTKLGKPRNKKVELTLLIHPQWLAGSPKVAPDGEAFGGTVKDAPRATAAWNQERARQMRLVEVRGKLPNRVVCPETGVQIDTRKGTVPRKSTFTCQAPTCGREQDVLKSIKASGTNGPMAAYALQAYCSVCHSERRPYGGRYFLPIHDSRAIDAAIAEWEKRKENDLGRYWPRSELPFGFMTHMLQGGVPNHGFTHWWTMFNPRQLLVHSQLLQAIWTVGRAKHTQAVREFVLGALQQYLRNQSMFCFWNVQGDKLEPQFSNNNYHPKATVIENSVYGKMGRGTWVSCTEALIETINWARDPWEVVSNEYLLAARPDLSPVLSGKSEKVSCDDPVDGVAEISCESATGLETILSDSHDLVVTDPPFSGLLHYSELSDFFYVWLRLVLKESYPDYFSAEYTPKALEVVANRAREPEDAEGFYQRLLTQCWKEVHRILKPGGILVFTFHHSEDEPWVAVLESLFDAGFYLEATYPIRSDETKGEGEFGSKKIEYDIIHVCRKRIDEPKPVSWGRMRREVLEDVRRLQSLLEHHAKAGLPSADLQVIRRGKALEYFSRHYGKVFVDEEREFSVKDALLGINQLLEEETSKGHEPPPVTAEPFTRQFLRVFEGRTEQPRDQMQKFLRGTGIAPDEFVSVGWCVEEKKVYRPVAPLEIARSWQGRHRRNMKSDYDQAMFFIGACFDGSGINVSETLKNENFRPHPALRSLLDWYARQGGSQDVRNAAARALAIYQSWEQTHQEQARQLALFYE
jgi:putative DNA methylase